MAALTLARAYQTSFDSRPHTTLAVTGGCLNALGDIVAQWTQNITRKPHDKYAPFDGIRTLRFFVFGASISPFLGRWNTFLERQFPLRALHGSRKVSTKALLKRVAADQLVMAPIGLVAFIGSMGVLEGRSRQQIAQKYRDLFMPTLLTNWSVWPVVQVVNFRYMPLPFRVPFQSTCGVFWTLYLSTVNSREERKQDRDTAMRRTLG
ncbi:hypothetical protein FB45DRAFT_916372 [Roridomyces roridus]|uniref:Uncharacterized protein n=1 Tax=Roridomyces roridus TaxID=1738132 RepID=A0AAD7BU74_9AGAR|nr:hypothetical protein FB45DRAFT_916372 [Roridomyces roridus]